MSDTLSLRERIAQRLWAMREDWSHDYTRTIADAILPVVEQEIQQAREKAEYFLRLAAEQHGRDVAALADHNTHIRMIEADAGKAHEIARQMLLEKDAQIAALHRLLNYALNGWGAHARKDMEHEEIGRIRREALRETPAPPEPVK